MLEIKWKRLDRFGFSKYEASNNGDFRHKKNKIILKQLKGVYLSIGMWNDLGMRMRKSSHNLIACLFLREYDTNSEYVNHIDGNKHNNNIYNLEITTKSGNMKHADVNGLMNREKAKLTCIKNKSLSGENNGMSKLKENDVKKIKSLLKTDISQSKIASLFNVNRRTISSINTGKLWCNI